MSKYFEKFPQVFYPISPDAFRLATDITIRAKFEEAIKKNNRAVIDYRIKDGDTPDNIAYRFYGASNLHWVIMMLNDILDPYYDWPVPGEILDQYIEEKYGDKLNNIHHGFILGTDIEVDIPVALLTENEGMEKILLESGPLGGEFIIVFNGNTGNINEKIGTYTNRQWEILLNDRKRDIKLLRPEFINQAVAQLKSKLSQT